MKHLPILFALLCLSLAGCEQPVNEHSLNNNQNNDTNNIQRTYIRYTITDVGDTTDWDKITFIDNGRYEKWNKNEAVMYDAPIDLGIYKINGNKYACYHDRGKGFVAFHGTIYDTYITCLSPSYEDTDENAGHRYIYYQIDFERFPTKE